MKKIVSINKVKEYYGHLLEMVNISSDKLIRIFGEPEAMESSKTDWEWVLEFEGGSILYIYDWKCGKNYHGEHGLDIDEIPVWHIGGQNKDKQLCKELVAFLNQEEWPCYEDIRLKMIKSDLEVNYTC